jgi:hypothetical protein
MNWLDKALEILARGGACGYRPTSTPATEPTALAALALLTWDRSQAALPKLRWLAQMQSADGSSGISAAESTPSWPTSLAVLAWSAWAVSHRSPFFTDHVGRAVDWLLLDKGKTIPHRSEGHDSMLVGWPWVAGTHSWLEPTALAVLALKAAGLGGHDRTREAVRLLIDRLLPDGGCNYGNTVVLGQTLRPHVQSTGLALLALAGEIDTNGRVQRSIEYLHGALSDRTAPASLSYALLAVTAQGHETCQAEGWLAAAAPRALAEQSALHLSLLALAAAGSSCPLIRMTKVGMTNDQ